MPWIAPIPTTPRSDDEPALAVPGRSSALFGLRITLGGVLYMIILALIFLAALNSEANLLLLLCGIGGGVLLISAVAPLRMVRGVAVERLVPERVVAGRSFRVTYVIRSRRRWGRVWSVIVGEMEAGRARKAAPTAQMPSAYIPLLGPGAEVRVEHAGVCMCRGVAPLPGLRITSRFPFGLFSCTALVPCAAVLHVYPAVGQFRKDPWRTRGGAAASAPQRRRDFEGLRDTRRHERTKGHVCT
jgi:uncharacterized protein (DUF58 family)